MTHRFKRLLAAWCACAGAIFLASDRAPPPGPAAASEIALAAVQAPESLPSETSENKTPHFIGVGSCASNGCHGANIRDPSDSFPGWQSSYSVWATFDKHSQAHRVLYGDEAKQIVRLLDRKTDNTEATPWSDKRCIGCHATPGFVPDPQADNRAANVNDAFAGVVAKNAANILAEGISCESCHGAASDWVTTHTYDRAKALGQGLTDTNNIAAMASNCVKCHVGAPEENGILRDMNHDMIAAGHPRLNFEFSTYMALMPKHWHEPAHDLASIKNLSAERKAKLQSEHADRELRLWAVGQAVSTAAVLDLSAARAESAAKAMSDDKSAVWPEFSEYDCFRCHHAFRGDYADDISPQQQFALGRVDATKKLKTAFADHAWSTWGSFQIPTTLSALNPNDPAVGKLRAVADAMAKPYVPTNDLLKYVADARAAAADFRDWSRQRAATSSLSNDAFREDVSTRMRNTASAASNRLSTWDQAAQDYLICVAMLQAQQAPTGDRSANAELESLLLAIFKELRFARNADVRFEGPDNFDPEKVRTLFQDLAKKLSNSGEK